MARQTWHILTGEYPPVRGGVADFARSDAAGLAAAGDEVHVWAPAAEGSLAGDSGVHVHPLARGFGPAGIREVDHALRSGAPGARVLVQYVAQAFGMKGTNLPFCAWLATVRRARVFVMFHEVAIPWERPARLKYNAAAFAMRAMAALLLARADRAFVSTSSWDAMLRPLAPHWAGTTWLPIPSNIPTTTPAGAREAVRAKPGLAGASAVVGHFGTYGALTAPLVERALIPLLEADPRRRALLVGHGGDAFARRLSESGRLGAQLVATGAVDGPDVAAHLAACDVLVQPYGDGVSTRRTSAMAGVALGVPTVTNEGFLSESVWRETGAVEIVAGADQIAARAAELLADPARAAAVGARGRAVYQERFAIDRSIRALRGEASG